MSLSVKRRETGITFYCTSKRVKEKEFKPKSIMFFLFFYVDCKFFETVRDRRLKQLRQTRGVCFSCFRLRFHDRFQFCPLLLQIVTVWLFPLVAFKPFFISPESHVVVIVVSLGRWEESDLDAGGSLFFSVKTARKAHVIISFGVFFPFLSLFHWLILHQTLVWSLYLLFLVSLLFTCLFGYNDKSPKEDFYWTICSQVIAF